MDFHPAPEEYVTDAIEFRYFLVPWDTEILGFPVAAIEGLTISRPDIAAEAFKDFLVWLKDRNVGLCSCRLAQHKLSEALFLQEQRFRYIELHYTPEIGELQSRSYEDPQFTVMPAQEDDQAALVECAASTFSAGRFHMDPRLGAEVGNERYRFWMRNAFERGDQVVLKCESDSEIVAFFVFESGGPGHCHWSLVGMTQQFSGKGLAKSVWRDVVAWHRAHGVEKISTAISSHNLAVMNLYIGLGFLFPEPQVTFHWMPDH
jgi:RimJ/RimL family protein N-acetyltransferase